MPIIENSHRILGELILRILKYTYNLIMLYYIVSNNPMILAGYPAEQVIAQDSYRNVLLTVRDYIHRGARLLSHPQAGSVKPYETPYRSVLISQALGELNFDSLQQIENAIERFDALAACHRPRDWPEQIIQDFQLIDFGLVKTGMESLDYK